MALCAAKTLELHKATMTYLFLFASKYGKWALLAHEVLAVTERPMMPTRTGAIFQSFSVENEDYRAVGTF